MRAETIAPSASPFWYFWCAFSMTSTPGGRRVRFRWRDRCRRHVYRLEFVERLARRARALFVLDLVFEPLRFLHLRVEVSFSAA
jgi:hypothetical protein